MTINFYIKMIKCICVRSFTIDISFTFIHNNMLLYLC